MSTLTDFLKDRADWQRRTQPDARKRLEAWVQSEQKLIRQVEEWLRAADPEGILEVRPENHELREEVFGSYSAVLRLRVNMGERRVEFIPRAGRVTGTVRLEDGRTLPIQGLVDMTNGEDRYRLYRILEDTGEAWLIGDDQGGTAKKLDQPTFESVMVDLLK